MENINAGTNENAGTKQDSEFDTGLGGGVGALDNDAPLIVGNTRREAIAKEYNEMTAQASAENEADESETEKTDSSAADEKAASGASSAKEESKKEDGTKTVPHEALHAERERRKELTLKNRELENRLKEFEKQLQELKSSKSVSPADGVEDETVTDDKERRIRELEAKLRADEESKAAAAKVAEAQKTETTIKELDAKLKAEGYPGFRLARIETDQELQRLYNEGELDLDDVKNPATWEKVFKEAVYPKIKEEFGPVSKKEVLGKKIEAKKKAGLVTNSGSRTADISDTEEAPSMEDVNRKYVESRRKSTVGARNQ